MKFFLLLLLVLTAPVYADTVMGTGGISPAVAGFSDAPFLWIDDTGSVNASVLSSLYGYNVVDPSFSVTGSGSLLLSEPFTVSATNTVTVDFSLFTAQNPATSFNELGFAVLLQGMKAVAILGAYRPDGVNHLGDLGNFPGTTFLGPSAGVTTTTFTHSNSSDIPPMVLGTQQYGVLADASNCASNCLTDVKSSYNPGAGTYRILYGSMNLDSGPNPNAAALAVRSVKVPEPSMPLQLAVAALLLFGVYRLVPSKAVIIRK